MDTTTAAGKMLALLDAFGPEQPDFSLAELSVRSGLPKSTSHRILAVLESWRGVERSASGRYRLGIKFFELGGLVQDRLRIREVALPYMEDLLATTREMVHLAKLDGNDVLYIERLVSHRSVRSPSRVAGRVPATCTGVGKAILAFSPPDVVRSVIAAGLPALTAYSITNPVQFLETLERVRTTGVSFDSEEACAGVELRRGPDLQPHRDAGGGHVGVGPGRAAQPRGAHPGHPGGDAGRRPPPRLPAEIEGGVRRRSPR